MITTNDPIRSQMCMCHNSSVVHEACAKAWSDLMTIFAMRATYDITIFRLWTQKSFIKLPSVSGGEWLVIVIHSSVLYVGAGHTVYHHCRLEKGQGYLYRDQLLLVLEHLMVMYVQDIDITKCTSSYTHVILWGVIIYPCSVYLFTYTATNLMSFPIDLFIYFQVKANERLDVFLNFALV